MAAALQGAARRGGVRGPCTSTPRCCWSASPAPARRVCCGRASSAAPGRRPADLLPQRSRSAARDFYRQLCHALGLNPAATAAAVFYAVSAHIETLGRERIHPVFLLDEAHLLHQDTLDHLHILLNYEWDSRALLSLILVRTLDLQDRLELRKNRFPLYSRIERRLRSARWSPTIPASTSRLWMSRAGADRDVFTADALTLLHEAAGSSLREIDRMATAALREAARRKKKLVERDVMARIVGDLGTDGS